MHDGDLFGALDCFLLIWAAAMVAWVALALG